ncbi:unnamed protein product [Mytilus edulis]|uniref:Uncharacterized protein n=1 Tax=Mytilus edulis TaxID=6550 RepID=A0A8S3PRK1_MYTED|nr:unnamed protein product [Mytilus edulis]
MDRGRNNFFEALHEVEEGEEPEDSDDERKRQGSSDESDSSGDEEPDPAAKRREPNKFDNLCDGVLNAMALVHTAMTELLEMKDEMIKHALPPTVLVKLATITGKVFRRKSAALKKLHEDYESNQRQLNIAIKRLKLVETQSKQIAREKKIMNWEKLFSKIMSNKGHGRRWKFLIESIKQKAKLGLEHVQEYTRALEESSDEEEEEEDDEMPLSLKPQDEADDSDKLSDLEEEGEDVSSDKGSVDSDQKLGLEEYESDAEREQSPKNRKKSHLSHSKPEMKEVAVWTHEPEYDHYLYVRVHTPKSIKQEELKCMITFQNKILKTGRLDVVEEVKPETPKEEEVKPKKGLIGSRAKPAEDKKAVLEKKMQEMRGDVPSIHEDVVFDLPGDRLPTPNKEEPDQNVKVSIHSGQMEEMIAMATINLEDIQVLELPTIVLPEPHGDDDAPHTPRDSDDVESISEDIDLMLGDKSVDKVKDEKKEADPAAKFASFDFPVYPLNQTRGKHEPCGYIPITFYYAKKFKPRTFVRQAGTMPFNDLVFEVAGIDLTSWKRDDMFREFADEALSAISFSPEVKTPEPPKPKTPEPPKPKTPEPPKPQTPELQKPPSPAKSPVRSPVKEEMVKKSDVESLVYKHNAELELVQQEYEKRLQSLMENMHEMQQTQEQQKQQLEQQQKQQKQRPPLVHQRPVSSESRKSAGSTGRKSANQNQAPPPKSPARLSPRVPSPDKKHEVPVHEQPPPVQKLVEISDSVDRIPQQSQSHPPPPHRPRKTLKPIAPRQNVTSAPASQQPDKHIATGVPEDFFERLQFFEDESKQHKKEMMEKTTKAIRDDLEKKLAGQHKLSKHEEEIYDALKDVSLPALFMPFQNRNNI